jgi:hypothetical protein
MPCVQHTLALRRNVSASHRLREISIRQHDEGVGSAGFQQHPRANRTRLRGNRAPCAHAAVGLMPGRKFSATISRYSSIDHRRRRSPRVITSIRCVRVVIRLLV